MTKAPEQKPLILIRIEAADEARCDSARRLAVIEPQWKVAQKEHNDAEESLFEAQGAARERFPDTAYDEETSQALNRRMSDHDTKLFAYKKLASRKKSLTDEHKKLIENELNLIAESREPGIFAAGAKSGPDGWKLVKLQDLTGSPDNTKDLKGQVWPSQGLEEQGYHTIGEFVQGIGRMIPELIDAGDLAKTTVENVSVAVYRFLEKRNLLDKWPSNVDAPSGEQMTILQNKTEEPEKPAPKPKKGKSGKKGQTKPPALKLAGTDAGDDLGDIISMPTAKEFHGSALDGESEFRDGVELRELAIGMRWDDLMQGTAFMTVRPTSEEFQIFGDTIAWSMSSLYIELLTLLRDGRDLPANPITEASFGTITDLVCYRATTMGEEEGNMVDEWTAWFSRQVCHLGGDAVRKLTQWDSDIGAIVAAHQDIEGTNGLVDIQATAKLKGDRDSPKNRKPAKKSGKKKPNKKKVTKKKTAAKKSAG